jgi:hypothetical protein
MFFGHNSVIIRRCKSTSNHSSKDDQGPTIKTDFKALSLNSWMRFQKKMHHLTTLCYKPLTNFEVTLFLLPSPSQPSKWQPHFAKLSISTANFQRQTTGKRKRKRLHS